MSKIDEAIQAIETARQCYQDAAAKLRTAATTTDEGLAQSKDIGVESLILLFTHAKLSLDQVTHSTNLLDEHLTTLKKALASGSG